MSTRRWLWLFVAAMIGVLPRAASASCPDLALPPTYNAGLNPSAIAVFDFNADSKMDLVTANGGSSDISVLLGNGNGTFAPTVNYPVGANSNPTSVAVGDFNADGKIDLAVATGGLNSVSILLGNGNGTFAAPTGFPAGNYPFAVAVGDFNRDGKLDLAVANANSNDVSILIGNGNGTFAAPVNYAAGAFPYAVIVTDLNNDNKADIVTPNVNSDSVSVLFGNGDGTFVMPATNIVLPAGSVPIAAVVADFNSDSKLDLAVANYFTGTVAIIPGDGLGGFGAPIFFNAAISPISISVHDWNGDGKSDLAVTDSYTNGLAIFLGNGDGTFVGSPDYLAGVVPTAQALADYDGDGFIDIAVSDGGSNFTGPAYIAGHISILFNRGDGTLASIVNQPLANTPAQTAIDDFNGDGKLDLAVAAFQGAAVSILMGNGDGTFAAPVNYAVGVGPLAVVTGDFNGDGKRDVATADYTDNKVSILLGNGNGTFMPAVHYDAGTGPAGLTTADFNGDGHTDIAVSNYTTSAIAILRGNGNGTFMPPLTYAAGTNPQGIRAGDFNGDGKADLAVANFGPAPNFGANSISIFLGNGDATFAAPVNYATGPTPVNIAVADFNGDGKIDLAVTNYANSTGGEGSVSILLGVGNGTFNKVADYAAGWPYSIVAADLDGDGKVDLAYLNFQSGILSVQLGHGDATFSAPNNLDVARPPNDLAARDLNGDGKIDLVTANSYANSISVLLNQTGATTITTPSSVPVGAAGITASVPRRPGSTYTWTLTGGAITSGQGTATIQYSAGAPGTIMTLSVVETSPTLCVPANGTRHVLVDFLDVPPTHPFHNFVVKIALNGITAGCGGGNYCPNNSVTRAQMAVFLLRARYGPSYTPPPATGTVFNDVPASAFAAAYIEELARQGITSGCSTSPPLYCPDAAVTRAQMAVFLLRTLLGTSYNPPPAQGIFQDVPPSSGFAKWIEDLYNRGITGGCSTNPPLYCPDDPNNRGQMAVFLTVTFNLQ